MIIVYNLLAPKDSANLYKKIDIHKKTTSQRSGLEIFKDKNLKA